MKLAGFQKAWLKEILAPGTTAAVMSLPRGQGKSTFAAALAVWATFDRDPTGSPSVPVVATTVGQAMRSVYNTCVAMVAAEPELASRSITFTAIGNARISVPSTGGECFPIANDVTGLQGLDPSIAICDEVGFQPVESWDSLLLASGKRDQSLVLGLGTPGLDRNNALWHLRSKVQEGAVLPGFKFKEYAADEGCRIDDVAQWKKANPAIGARFLRLDALRTSLALAPESAFRVFRLGQWVDGVESWLGDDGRVVWDQLEDPYEFVPGAPTWCGVDVGIKRDSSAVVSVQYRVDDPTKLHAKVKIWLPTKDEPVDVTDIMGYLRQQATTYRVGAISFDPRFFDVPAKMLYDEGLPLVEVPQSVEHMTPAIGALYELIRGGGMTHDRDSLFAQQVLNAVTRLNERGFTLSKGKSRGRIDAAIALALAVDRAQHKKKPRSRIVVL